MQNKGLIKAGDCIGVVEPLGNMSKKKVISNKAPANRPATARRRVARFASAILETCDIIIAAPGLNFFWVIQGGRIPVKRESVRVLFGRRVHQPRELLPLDRHDRTTQYYLSYASDAG